MGKVLGAVLAILVILGAVVGVGSLAINGVKSVAQNFTQPQDGGTPTPAAFVEAGMLPQLSGVDEPKVLPTTEIVVVEPTPEPIQPLGVEPVYSMETMGEMLTDGYGLFPSREDFSVKTQSVTNTMGTDGLLLISADPNSTLLLVDPTGKEVDRISSDKGFTATMVFPQGYTVAVQTPWNEDNGTWNVWGEFYIAKDGVLSDQFRWVAIMFWDTKQGKQLNYVLDGQKFIDLGPNPTPNN